MLYSILIKSESRFPVGRKKLRKRLERVLKDQGLVSEVEVSLALVGRERMRRLNQDYRGIDKATSVLSFSQLEKGAGEGFITSPIDVLYLGDIVICYPVAQELANEEGSLVDETIGDLAEHGLLNLLRI